MSRTKTFEARRIALESNNQAILKIWSDAIETFSDKQNIFKYSKEKEEVQEGTINNIISWTCDVFKCSYSDQGKLFTLEPLQFELDAGAFDFLNKFERKLLELAGKLGLNSGIDRDLFQNKALLTHPFGIESGKDLKPSNVG